MAGERHPVLPRLHEQRRAALPGHPSQPPGAFGDSGGADAHSSHLCHGESELPAAAKGTGDIGEGTGGGTGQVGESGLHVSVSLLCSSSDSEPPEREKRVQMGQQKKENWSSVRMK